ncbi:hypothetical protein [Methylocapsa sp. S129]|uniref:hypothetical protein n=1 Tax=Methylocapsa sp. S129 TaxID=1641869 RepID=UPI00131BBB4D|nr:hypothetical protein [Methylocapsa sp. S129]
MPANCCHPVGAHKRLRLPDTYVSSLMLDRALNAIARRAGAIDRNHDIPYLAGYSTDGKRIYIDRHLPPSFLYKGRKIEVDRYLLLHEEVEKTLIDQLDLHYQHAHQIATRAEEAAVRADGVSWRAYDRFMQQYVKEMGDERLTKLPGDLDLKPYRDEHDYDLMRRMKGATEDMGHPLSKETALSRRLAKALGTRAAILEAAKAAKPVSGRAGKTGAGLV